MIIDIFFYKEDNPNIINLRHSILSEVVDKFIMCSDINLNDERFIKIGVDAADRFIKEQLNNFSDDTLFIISNADEIINPTYIPWFKKTVNDGANQPISTYLKYINKYNNACVFDAYTEKPISYQGVYFCNKKIIQNYNLTEIINSTSFLSLTENNTVVENTGWAFKKNKLKLNEILVEASSTDLPEQVTQHPPLLSEKTFNNSIPVIGTAVVNNSYWVTRLISSVDFPVDTFVIVNNGGGNELADELEHVRHLNKRFINEIKIINLPGNIGCAGWWNLIIKCYMLSPSWVLVNDDVAFTPGLLKELHTKSLIENIGMIHGANYYIQSGHYDLFLIKDFVIENYGLFDENCFPAYWEDTEYFIRLKANGNVLPRILSLDHQYYHGESFKYTTGSKTIDHIVDKSIIHTMADENLRYLIKKWGNHPYESFLDGQYPLFSTPFNLPTEDLRYSAYDLKFNKTKIIPQLTIKQI